MVEDALGKFGGYWLDFDFDYILNKRADIHILFDLLCTDIFSIFRERIKNKNFGEKTLCMIDMNSERVLRWQ